MKYGIVIFPSKELQDKANSYRKRYDTKYALIPPHLTLKESFEVEDGQLQTIVAEMKEIAKETKPIPVRVVKFSSFQPVSNTIYLKVQENEQLIELQEKLNSGVLQQPSKYQYVPHITIGQDMADDEFFDVIGRLGMANIDIQEKADRMQLLYELENGSWTVYETFKFGEEA